MQAFDNLFVEMDELGTYESENNLTRTACGPVGGGGASSKTLKIHGAPQQRRILQDAVGERERQLKTSWFKQTKSESVTL